MWTKLNLALFFGSFSKIRSERDAIKRLEMLENREWVAGAEALDQVYHQIFEENTGEDLETRSIAIGAYKWVMCAETRLNIQKLREVASAADDENAPTQEPISLSELERICSNFIVSLDWHVRFAQVSVREYLVRRRIGSVQEFSDDQAHIQIATTCIARLRHPNAKEPHSSPITGQYERGYFLLHYAKWHCFDHVNAITRAKPEFRPRPL